MTTPDTKSCPAAETRGAPVGVLALQGSFPLHARALERSGAAVRFVRRLADLDDLRGLVIPGGESTTMAILARRYELTDALRDAIAGGLPVFGTCAGAILLGHAPPSENGTTRDPREPERLEVAPLNLERNAYGRQLDSFTSSLELTIDAAPFHGVFIRAPRILEPEDESDVQVLGRHDGEPVLVRWRHLLLGTFHPELTDDLRVHRYFLGMCGG